MHLATLAGPRRRTRRALLAAVLPAAVAAFALPAAADAATTVELSGGTLSYRADTEKTNTVAVRDLAGAVEVRDLRGVTARGVLCANVDPLTVRCGVGTQRLHAFLGDRNDSITIRVAMPVIVEGGSGNNTYIGAFGPEPTNVAYHGGSGFDEATYQSAGRGVRVETSTNAANDGRLNFDRDNVMDDVEVIRGSSFADSLSHNDQSGGIKTLDGNGGDDILHASGQTFGTVFDMGSAADGADRVIGGSSNFTAVDYSARTQPVTATLRFGGADDGAAGERDEIQADSPSFNVKGGQAGDTIRAAPGSLAHHSLHGNGGDDTIEGGDSGDFIEGGPGTDPFLLGNGGGDQIDADDDVGETVACGGGIDFAQLDSLDGHSSCENRRVGVLHLAPKTLRAQAGEAARLRLSWRHPRGWRRIESIKLRLMSGGVPAGEITIDPRNSEITSSGAIRLALRGTRLERDGKTVSVRLALRLNPSLAGQTLKAEVEATDRRGARQFERDAGTIRVAR